MKQFSTVFKFEIMSYFKSKPYLISTAVMVCIVFLLGIVPSVLSAIGEGAGGNEEVGSESSAADAPVGVYDIGGMLNDEILDFYLGQGGWAWLDPVDSADIEGAVSSQKYSIVMEVSGLDYTITMLGSDAMRVPASACYDLVKASCQSDMLKGIGLGQGEIRNILGADPKASYVTVGKDVAQAFLLGYVLILALYITILLYGQFVMTSVVTEKASKTIELLVISVKPIYLIFGKVAGAGLAGLAQFGVVSLAGGFSLGVIRNSLDGLPPFLAEALNFSGAGITLIYALVFFLLGFFTYAFLYAAFASTISRTEDINTVALFPMLPFIVTFFVAITGMANPAAGYVTVCSFVPFLSPLVMFMRICMTDVPLYQTLAAVLINIATVAGVGAFSAKLYRVGVLMYGTKPTPKAIWRNFRRA